VREGFLIQASFFLNFDEEMKSLLYKNYFFKKSFIRISQEKNTI
jgi:hypothetical protein